MAVRQAELDREIEVIQRRISDLSARPLPRFERCRPAPERPPSPLDQFRRVPFRRRLP